jgi:hypothetical protein
MAGAFYSYSVKELGGAGNLADSVVAPTVQRPNEFLPTNPSVVNTVNVAIAPAAPTAGNLNTTIQYAQSVAADSVAQFGTQSTPVVVTLLETLDDAGDLASYLIQPLPKFWFGNIQIVMNGLTDAQRTTITNLDIGSQISVTKTFPKSTPSTVTQLMALEGISHDISPDRHIVTLYTNPARIYTYFIVGGYPIATSRTNLLINPNFEVDTTGWATTGTVARTTAQFYSGVASASMTYTGAGIVLIEQSTRPVVTAGLSYTASFYMKQSVDAGVVVCNLMWYNAGGSVILDDSHQSNDPTTAWQRFTYTRTAPANAVSCSFRVYQFNGEGGGAVATVNYVDAFLIEQASSALPYFDGTYVNDYAGYGLENKSWTGTANASTSTASWYLGNTRTNLVINPNFEVNADYWTAAAVTLTRITTAAYIGTACLQMSSPTAGDVTARMAYDPNTSIGAGVELTASCYVYNFAGNNRGHRIDVRCFNSGGSVIQTFTGAVTTVNVGSGWTRISVTGTTPALTASVDAVVFCQTTNTSLSNVTYVDAIMVEQASSALPYFDGTYAETYTGYTLTRQQWNGTVGVGSTSTGTWGLTSSFVGSQLGDDTKGLG